MDTLLENINPLEAFYKETYCLLLGLKCYEESKAEKDNIILGVRIAIKSPSPSLIYLFADNHFIFSNTIFNEIRANTLEDYCDR